MEQTMIDLHNAVRDVPDFPKRGILFKDITTLLKQGILFRQAIDRIYDHFRERGIQKVVGIESRGFIIGAPVAYLLGAGVVPVRKRGKLPSRTVSVTYDLEYGTDTLEMHEDAVAPGEKVLVIDDLLATGGTVSATLELLGKKQAEVTGLAFLIELSFLEGRKRLNDYEIFSLLKY